MPHKQFRPYCRILHSTLEHEYCSSCGNVIINGRLLATHPNTVVKSCELDKGMLARYQNVIVHVDILKVVSDYINVRIAQQGIGTCYCPWHVEPCESLVIKPKTGRFRCYICATEGTVVDFVSLIEKRPLDEVIEEMELYVASDGKE